MVPQTKKRVGGLYGDELGPLDLAFRGLASGVRRTMLHELCNEKDLTSGQLAEAAGVTPPRASYHLRTLVQAGLAEVREAADSTGRKHYRLNHTTIRRVMAEIAELWDGRM